MSNLIKAPFIYFDKKETRVINSDVRFESFVPLNKNNLTRVNGANDIASANTDNFVAGLDAINLEKLLKEEEELLGSKAENIINNAKLEAEQIITKAKALAMEEVQNIYEEARKEGYMVGFKEGNEQISNLEEELKNKELELNMKYEEQVDKLEGEFVSIFIKLMDKIVGLDIESKKAIILHLVDNAIKNNDMSKNYVIHVSKEDFEIVSSNREEIMTVFQNEVVLDIIEDGSLTKNQCLIETDNRIIDCSLDMQLNCLKSDLCMLANIDI